MNLKLILPAIIWLTAISLSMAQIDLVPVNTPVRSGFRGLFALDESTCWVSGTDGAVYVTYDSGKTWKDVSPAGYNTLQFRDMHAFNNHSAVVLSAGLPAVICRTTDGGNTWKEVYRNEAQGVFFDAMDFWDSQRGLAFSDAPANKLLILKTENGGKNWKQIPYNNIPEVYPRQGGFAASGTCIDVFGKSSALIGLGGPQATLLRTDNSGETWTKTMAPIDSGNPSKGIFSINMLNENTGVMVGGDYMADSLSQQNIAFTTDGGKTWNPATPEGLQHKYLSSVSYYNDQYIFATSRTGIRYSTNGGKKWISLPQGYYSVHCVKEKKVCWCSGNEGRVAIIKLP